MTTILIVHCPRCWGRGYRIRWYKPNRSRVWTCKSCRGTGLKNPNLFNEVSK